MPVPTAAWSWNPSEQFATPSGSACFNTGGSYSYAHGGISLQECLTPVLVVSGGASNAPAAAIVEISWKGLRCTVAVDGQFGNLSLDIRTQAGNPASSVVVSVKTLRENGTASVVVENERLEGNDAFLVLLSATGELVDEASTKIGGG